MQAAFYGPVLAARWVPGFQALVCHGDRLPHYAERIGELKAKGAELIVIFGIGRVAFAFWEPHFAGEFASLAEWKLKRIASERDSIH